MKNPAVLWLAVSSLCVLMACNTSKTSSGTANSASSSEKTMASTPRPSLVNRKWDITTVMGKDVRNQRLAITPFLRFSGESDGFRLNGSDGCNNLMGSYGVGDQSTISISRVGFTRRACPENGDINSVLTEALNQVNQYVLSEDGLTLTLNDKEGKAVLSMDLAN